MKSRDDHVPGGNQRDAEEAFRQLLVINPHSFAAWNGLGSALKQQEHLEEAADCFRRALKLNPGYVEAHNNLGNALAEQGEWEAAMASYRRALDLAPHDAEIHWNQSMVMLVRGDFDNGWREHEFGRLTGKFPQQNLAQPTWQGEPIAGRTILLHAEQGFGDGIQFVRYAPLVKALGTTVIVGCHRPLVQLLRSCPGITFLVGSDDPLPPFDLHVPFLSLPRIFQTSLATIPANVPYLAASPALAAVWGEALQPIRGFRIGINWHGREGLGHFRRRDIPLEHFIKLNSLPGIQLIRLQKSVSSNELANFSSRLQIFSPGEDFDDSRGPFMDTAAIMKNLDLVITSDTAIAHLAGALGVPVWVALPFAPDWRWLLDRSDSPWYPTMRLFRQTSPGDWNSVFADIGSALRKCL